VTGSALSGCGSGRRPVSFDEFISENGIPITVADQFDGYAVDVALPPGWEPFESAPGTRVCIWRGDPFRKQFCANVVLTMTQIEAVLDPAAVFAMICEWQAQLMPGTQEKARNLSPATEGPGDVGTLALHMTADIGPLESMSVTRILNTEKATLIAQLTLTALPDSPVDRANIGLAFTHVDPTAATETAMTGRH